MRNPNLLKPIIIEDEGEGDQETPTPNNPRTSKKKAAQLSKGKKLEEFSRGMIKERDSHRWMN